MENILNNEYAEVIYVWNSKTKRIIYQILLQYQI